MSSLHRSIVLKATRSMIARACSSAMYAGVPLTPCAVAPPSSLLLLQIRTTRRPAKWALDLLAGEMVRLPSHEILSRDTVGAVSTRWRSGPGEKKMWCVPDVNAEYVARM